VAGLQSDHEQPYYHAMREWLATARRNWDVILALTLFFLAIAVTLGPGYYFAIWYLLGCGYVVRVALKR
jgi:hypothetical protein